MLLGSRTIFLTLDDPFRQAFGPFLQNTLHDTGKHTVHSVKTGHASIKRLVQDDIGLVIIDLSKQPAVSLDAQIKLIGDLSRRGKPVVVLADRYTAPLLRERKSEFPFISRPSHDIAEQVNGGRFSHAVVFGDLLPPIVQVVDNPSVQIEKMSTAFASDALRSAGGGVLHLAKTAKSSIKERKRHVLVVDDDSADLDTVADKLKDAGYIPITCQYGAHANEALRTDPRVGAVVVADKLRETTSCHITGLDVVRCAVEQGIPPILMNNDAYLDHTKLDAARLPYIRKPSSEFLLLDLKEAMLWPDNWCKIVELALVHLRANEVVDSVRSQPGMTALVGAPVRTFPVSVQRANAAIAGISPVVAPSKELVLTL